jgi:transcriptional regulator with XRE-family HTH domain
LDLSLDRHLDPMMPDGASWKQPDGACNLSLVENESEAPATPRAFDHEAAFGARVRSLRKTRGWSQEHLAEQMQMLGHNWLQSTVTKTENGQRPLRLNEAAALAEVLAVPLAEATRPLPDSADLAALREQIAQVSAEEEALRDSIEKLKMSIAASTAQFTSQQRRHEQLRYRLAELSALWARTTGPRHSEDAVGVREGDEGGEHRETT